MQTKNNLYYAWMEFLIRKVPTERNRGQIRQHGDEAILTSYALDILHSYSLKPKSNTPDTLQAIALGKTRRTTVSTRLSTDEGMGSSWISRFDRVRNDKKIASLCMQIQNVRDAIRRGEMAEVRNVGEINRLRDKRTTLRGKVHRLYTAL